MLSAFLTTLIGVLLLSAGVCGLEHWLLGTSFVILAGIAFYVRDGDIEDREYEIGFNDGVKSRTF